MIAPLRTWHRRATAVLAVGVPALLVAAIASRPEAPVNAALPSTAASPATAEGHPLAWTRSDIHASLVFSSDGAATVALDAGTLAADPDVLAYWLETDDSGEPPLDGRLLGGVRGAAIRRITLPPGAETRGGRVVLYSLAHDEVLASTSIDASGGQP